MRMIKLAVVSALFLVSICAATVSVSPAVQDVSVGQSFTLDVAVTDVTDLLAWQLDLGFDPTVVHAVSMEDGPFLTSNGDATFSIAGDIDNVAGTVANSESIIIGSVAGVSGSGVIATFHFIAVANGTSPITIFNTTFLDSFGQGMEFDVATGSVNVSGVAAVPEPASVLLAAAGLLVVGALRRRMSGRLS